VRGGAGTTIAGALADYERALAAAPDSPAVLNNRGVALAALNRHDEAIRDYTRALERSPGFDNARFHRALSASPRATSRTAGRIRSRWSGSEIQTRAPNSASPPGPVAKTCAVRRSCCTSSREWATRSSSAARPTPSGSRRARRARGPPPLKELLAQVRGVERVVALGEELPPSTITALLACARRLRRDTESPRECCRASCQARGTREARSDSRKGGSSSPSATTRSTPAHLREQLLQRRVDLEHDARAAIR